MSTIDAIIQLRRGLKANLPATAADGEAFFCTDTGELFIWSVIANRMIPVGTSGAIQSGSANQVLATPNGTSGVASIRTLVPADVPNLPESQITNLTSDLAATEKTANKGAASGYAPLDSGSLVPAVNSRVQSVAGKTGAVTLVEGDIANLIADLAACERIANKDAASGYAGLDASALLKATEFPSPGPTSFGGVKSLAAVVKKYLTSIGTDGVPVAAQPQLSDLSDTPTANKVVASPNGSTGALTARALVAADIPNLPESQITNLVSDLAGKQASLGFSPENVANKDAASGYAGLDASTRLKSTEFPTGYDVTGLSTLAGPYFIGGYGPIVITTTSNGSISPNGNNEVSLVMFYLPFRMIIRKVTFSLSAKSANTGAVVNFGLYDIITLNKLCECGAVTVDSTATTGLNAKALVTPYTIEAGWYYFAQSCSDNSATFTLCSTLTNSFPNGASGAKRNGRYNAVMSGGVLPSNLGSGFLSAEGVAVLTLWEQ